MNKIKFKGTTLYRKKVVNNILDVYNNDTFDFSLDWYKLANLWTQEIADKYDVDYLQVCGVVAAFSPLKNWQENKRIAELYISTGVSKHTKRCTDKARVILADSRSEEFILATLNGNKIQNFFLNLAFPTRKDPVTIDRHAVSICAGKSLTNKHYTGITDNLYSFFKSCFIDASDIAGVRPSLMQSITWEKWRELKKLN